MRDEDVFELLSSLQGRFIRKIRRVSYTLRGKVTSNTGPVEITFADGSIALLDAAPDGEALVVKAAAWADYFAEPLSDENRQFVEQSGKWTAFDVSEQEPYSRLIRERIVQAIPIKTVEDKIKGVTLTTAQRYFRVEIEADEVSVDIA